MKVTKRDLHFTAEQGGLLILFDRIDFVGDNFASLHYQGVYVGLVHLRLNPDFLSQYKQQSATKQ